MTFERIRDLPDKSTRSLRRGISAAGVVLITSVFGASFASAAPLEETTHAVESVTATPAPSLPSAAPPVTPPAPVGTPTGPQVPVDHVPVEVPTGKTPTSLPTLHPASTPPRSATKVASPGAELSSPRGAASSAKESAGMVASTSTEAATQRAAASVRNDANVGSDSSRGQPLVESAEAAPLPRWFAYVWTAIALGDTGTSAALLAGWESASSLPALTSLSASDAVRLLSRLMGIAGNSDASTFSKQPATPIGSLAPPPVAPVSASGLSLFLAIITSLLALVGLIALVRLTVGEEFFSSLRWPH
jgi:hypothetical protein